MIIPVPMPLDQPSDLFDDPNWIYELKHIGIRAIAVIEGGICRLLSENRHPLQGYQNLRVALARESNAFEAVLDGTLAALDNRPSLASLLRSHNGVRFLAFDLMWLNGQDLRAQPLLDRKEQLRLLLPTRSASCLYVDHAQGTGHRLFRRACQMHLEGIVAKRADSPYDLQHGESPWRAILNPAHARRNTHFLKRHT